MEISLHLSRSKYGKYHDLGEYFEDLKELYFEDDTKFRSVSIEWGRWPKSSSDNISIGLYHPSTALITVSPILDSKKVPKYFVNHVIFHEMLHHVVPWEETVNGYSKLHTPAFKEAEARYKYHTKALNWEDKHLANLISLSRKRKV